MILSCQVPELVPIVVQAKFRMASACFAFIKQTATNQRAQELKLGGRV